jgi:hypothetical protein
MTLAYSILIGASFFGAAIAWAWFGPFAGMIWSGACFGFGTMFGLMLQGKKT